MWGMLANLMRCLSAETAHGVAVATLHYNLGPRPEALSTKTNLGVTLAGLEFTNPLGLAAGFDKNAACLLYTSPSPRDGLLSRMPSSA